MITGGGRHDQQSMMDLGHVATSLTDFMTYEKMANQR